MAYSQKMPLMVDGGTRLTQGISLKLWKILIIFASALCWEESLQTLYGYGVIACLLIEAYARKWCLPATCSV